MGSAEEEEEEEEKREKSAGTGPTPKDPIARPFPALDAFRRAGPFYRSPLVFSLFAICCQRGKLNILLNSSTLNVLCDPKLIRFSFFPDRNGTCPCKRVKLTYFPPLETPARRLSYSATFIIPHYPSSIISLLSTVFVSFSSRRGPGVGARAVGRAHGWGKAQC